MNTYIQYKKNKKNVQITKRETTKLQGKILGAIRPWTTVTDQKILTYVLYYNTHKMILER